MSVKKNDKKNHEFVERLIEIYGTKQPSELAQKLQISYQAARNYLNGRLPDTNVLLTIAAQTPYSIHWLLSGQGEKYVSRENDLNTLLLSDQMKSFVRQQCLEVFNEIFALRKNTAPPNQEIVPQRIVKIASEQIKIEKTNKSSAFSEKQS